MNEQYLTVAEVAKMLDLSRDTVRRMFAEEPGVVNVRSKIGRPGRRYRILRIPRGVLERVLASRASLSETGAPGDGLGNRKGDYVVSDKAR
jgi:excisionase family DNA binding protein